MSSITPSRPYLLRALYEWVIDNDMTPHVVVDAEAQGVQVPVQFVQDGQITLNIAPGAVQGLLIDDQGISFSARFGGVPMSVYAPMVAVLAIFTRENGMGMGFGMEPGAEVLLEQAAVASAVSVSEQATGVSQDDEQARERKPTGKPSLRVVK